MRRTFGLMRRLPDGYVQMVAVAFTEEGARRLYIAHSEKNPGCIYFVREISR